MLNRYAPLGEYGVIGDLHAVALVSMDASATASEQPPTVRGEASSANAL